jgi:hypothetical protein
MLDKITVVPSQPTYNDNKLIEQLAAQHAEDMATRDRVNISLQDYKKMQNDLANYEAIKPLFEQLLPYIDMHAIENFKEPRVEIYENQSYDPLSAKGTVILSFGCNIDHFRLREVTELLYPIKEY